MAYVLFDDSNEPYEVSKDNFYKYINNLDISIYECGSCIYIIHNYFDSGKAINDLAGVIELKQ